MQRAEKRSLGRFLAIYIISTIALIWIASWLYYQNEHSAILQDEKNSLNQISKEYIQRLQTAHQESNDEIVYPTDSRFKSAIFDSDSGLIFSTINSPKLNKSNLFYAKNHNIYFTTTLSPYYLGAAYLVIEKPFDNSKSALLLKQILLFNFFALVVIVAVAYLLGRLFVRPMRESYSMLNEFIKDTTHELNTPISTILTNIELIEDVELPTNLKNSCDRINIAAKTLSGIYQDLIFLKLQPDKKRVTRIDISTIISQRLDYFKLAIDGKNIRLEQDIKGNIFHDMQESHFIRLFDNLLSNAIKYNNLNGYIKVNCDNQTLFIENSGYGIKKEHLSEVMDRFKRFNNSEGGFGIGLSVVDKIAQIYELDVAITSKVNSYTKVVIKW